MQKQQILEILKQIFQFTPELENTFTEKLETMDEEQEGKLIEILLNYTTKQNELLVGLNKALIMGKNKIEEITDESNEQSAEDIIAKI